MFARRPPGFHPLEHSAPRVSAVLPASCGPACEHRLFSCPQRIMADSSGQAKYEPTSGLINNQRRSRFIPASSNSREIGCVVKAAGLLGTSARSASIAATDNRQIEPDDQGE